ncbi:MAG: polyphosphate kinase 1 [Pseudomonadota bacterium]
MAAKKLNPGADAGSVPDLAHPSLYINRELSQLEFCRRVLAQARDARLPLLERLRFVCITSSVLDEFFEIRVAGLKQQEAYASARRGADGLSPTEQLQQIARAVHEISDELYTTYRDVVVPQLDLQSIRFLNAADWSDRQQQWLRRYFKRELAPILSPIGLDPAHPFPQPQNKALNFIVTVEGEDVFGRQSGKAVVPAPRALPRVIALPDTAASGGHDFVLLSSIIAAYVGDLFRGMKITGCYQFRVTRNSDLFVDEEEVDDLKRAIEGELSQRHYGDAVRLEVASDCPAELVAFLRSQFKLGPDDVYGCDGPVNLNRLAAVPDMARRADLEFPPFVPQVPKAFAEAADPFAAISGGDILVHHPFDAFGPFVDLLRSAARDPSVLAIRQTLYRTGTQSAVVEALMEAARNGKEVLVIIELRARFDEEANIELADVLQEAGAQVMYGVVGHKTHAKMCLVLRREGRSLKRYVHLGTGNYHQRTARLYTDYGLFTCDRDIGEDVQTLFQQLTTIGKAGRLRRLLQSPFSLHRTMIELVDAEIAHQRAGRPAWIKAKMNALIEPEIIQALYRASQAGVRVDLVIRGICALRPGITGVSENIRVRSIIGRFLEHTRMFAFANAGDTRVYLSSADWMGRNFFNRVETCFPVDDADIRMRIMDEFDLYLQDNTQAWVLKSAGSYRRLTPGKAKRVSAQARLMGRAGDAAA